MRIERTADTPTGIERVFAYLADFTTTTAWDPGTLRTVLVKGTGGVGSIYRNASRFMGRETVLEYTLVALDAPGYIELRGQGPHLIARDSMRLSPLPSGGTRVTYTADFTFDGWLRWVVPAMAPFFRRLGDDAQRGLTTHLDALPQGDPSPHPTFR
ncbi:MAG: SRPBCC family protein [Propionibacterium sp.]|nr:SRPBCC family protein [Propionibacterium sp.]